VTDCNRPVKQGYTRLPGGWVSAMDGRAMAPCHLRGRARLPTGWVLGTVTP